MPPHVLNLVITEQTGKLFICIKQWWFSPPFKGRRAIFRSQQSNFWGELYKTSHSVQLVIPKQVLSLCPFFISARAPFPTKCFPFPSIHWCDCPYKTTMKYCQSTAVFHESIPPLAPPLSITCFALLHRHWRQDLFRFVKYAKSYGGLEISMTLRKNSVS